MKAGGWMTFVMGTLNGIGLTCFLVFAMERCT